MKFEDLNKESQEYIDRYIRGHNKTREQAIKELLVKAVIKEYEKED